jgi:Uma2 family endonuclease
VIAWFLQREASLSLEAIPELRMLVTSNRVRICDVAIIREDAPEEQVPTIPPSICVEIMSPEDRLSRAIKVLKDYRAMGVQHIWLIDPQERLAYTFDEAGLKQQEDLVLRAERGIAMDVSEMFSALDKKKNKESA